MVKVRECGEDDLGLLNRTCTNTPKEEEKQIQSEHKE